MLTPEEEKFIQFWSENRNKVQSGFRQYRIALTIGLIFSIGVILNLMSGWYSRANMVANSQSTPVILLLAMCIVIIFCSHFYRQFRREANEQRYKELLFKKEKGKAAAGVQQDKTENGQSN